MRILLTWVLLAGACEKKTSAPAPPEKQTAPVAGARDAAISSFWQWFAKNAARLRDNQDFVGVMNEISQQLAKIDPGVFGEIAVDKSERSLILTADGKRELFPLVQALHAARPTVAGWTVIAFRPRMPAALLKGMQFEMEGKKYDPTAITFSAERDGDKLNIRVYSPREDVSNPAKSMMFTMIDHVIGEYDTETKIAGIDFGPASARPKTAKPLTALAQAVDEIGK
jgi:hypothetical protein